MRTKTTLAVRLVTRVTRVTRVDSPKTLIDCACVISRSSNYGLQFGEDLIRPTKLNMAAKFVETFIFHRGIGERNAVQNLKLTFIY